MENSDTKQTGEYLFDNYLKASLERGVIDHSIRANMDDQGRISFYIHPHGVDGETKDFWVWEDCVWDKNNLHPQAVSQMMVECMKPNETRSAHGEPATNPSK